MPINTFQTILSTDKLQSGFRAKFNANVALLITDIVDNGDATATVELQGGTNFVIDLNISFYTKAQVQALITAVQAAVWGAITGDVTQQTDVVGNLGVITPIDALLFSVNFAIGAADTDNPFLGTAASGYASFSVSGIGGTGWQLLIKEGAIPEIKFRVYYGGVWFPWTGIAQGGTPVVKNIASGLPDVYTLSAPELAIINSYGRYPNFLALLADTGTYVNDIQPTCLGVAGGFTSVTVQLHGDGSGLNVDNTIIQFS